MDGVLFDSERVSVDCYIEACRIIGVDDDPSIMIQTIGRTYDVGDKLFIEHFGDEALYRKLINKTNEMFHKEYADGNIPFKKGAKELMQFLDDHNIPYALATSSPMYMVEKSFFSQGYKEIPIKYIMTGDDVINSKPHPEIFLKAAEKMGIDPKDCMVVEDSRNGILAASATGGIAILVPDIVPVDEDMINAATYKMNDLLEVKQLLEEKLI